MHHFHYYYKTAWNKQLDGYSDIMKYCDNQDIKQVESIIFYINNMYDTFIFIICCSLKCCN